MFGCYYKTILNSILKHNKMALVDICFKILKCANLADAQLLARSEMMRLGEANKPIAVVRPYSPGEDRRIAYEEEVGEDDLTRREREAEIDRLLANI